MPIVLSHQINVTSEPCRQRQIVRAMVLEN